MIFRFRIPLNLDVVAQVLVLVVGNVVAKNGAVSNALVEVVYLVHWRAHRLSDTREQAFPTIEVGVFRRHSLEMTHHGCGCLHLIGPRPCIVLRIINSHRAVDRVGVNSRVTLLDPGIEAQGMAVLIGPGPFVESSRLDDQRIPLPAGYGDAKPTGTEIIQGLTGGQPATIDPKFSQCPSPLKKLQYPALRMDKFNGFILFPDEPWKSHRIACMYWIVGAGGRSASRIFLVYISGGLTDVYRHPLLHRFGAGWCKCRTGIFCRTFIWWRTFPVSTEIPRIELRFGCGARRCFLPAGFCPRLTENHARNRQAQGRCRYYTHGKTRHFETPLLVDG